MSNLTNYLKITGMNEREIQVYIGVLELGETSLLELHKKTKIHRPALYKIIKDLVGKGFILTRVFKKRKVYIALDPQKLMEIVDENRKKLVEVLPELIKNHAINQDKKLQISYYEGKEDVTKFFEDGLNSKDLKIYTIFPSKNMAEVFGKKKMEEIIQKRIEKDIFSQNIVPISNKTFFEDSEETFRAKRETRYIEEGIDLSMGIVIVDDRVNFFAPTEENFAFQVRSKSFSKTMKFLFENLWNNLEK